MSVSDVINLTASLITIIGGIYATYSAIRRRPRRELPEAQPYPSPPPYQPLPAPQAPPAPRLPRGQPAQGASSSLRVRPGCIFGFLLGIPAAVVLSAGDFSYRNFGNNIILFSLSLIALAVLGVYAGISLTIRGGTLRSAIASGLMLSITTSFGVAIYASIRDIGKVNVAGGVAAYVVAMFFLVGELFVVFGLPMLALSILSGVVGRLVYRRNVHPAAPGWT